MSLRWMTPSAWSLRATASGVPPWPETSCIAFSSSGGTWPPCCRIQATTASPAPLRMDAPSTSMPLMRVWAVNSMKSACSGSMWRPRMPKSLASTTMERPSGVSSASEASCAASASSSALTPGIGMNSDAWRLPSVIVPVLSSSSVFTSPAASTARPDIASTL